VVVLRVWGGWGACVWTARAWWGKTRWQAGSLQTHLEGGVARQLPQHAAVAAADDERALGRRLQAMVKDARPPGWG
jgi:hypothetical protein